MSIAPMNVYDVHRLRRAPITERIISNGRKRVIEDTTYPCRLSKRFVDPSGMKAGLQGTLCLVPEAKGTLAPAKTVAHLRALEKGGYGEQTENQTGLHSFAADGIREIGEERGDVKEREPIIGRLEGPSQVMGDAAAQAFTNRGPERWGVGGKLCRVIEGQEGVPPDLTTEI